MRREARQLTMSGWLLGAMVLLAPAVARAQNPLTASTAMTFNITSSEVKLTFVPAAPNISFPNSDPDTTPTIAASPVTVTASARTGAPTDNVMFTMVANDDFRSGTNPAIAISRLSWTGTGNFSGGAFSSVGSAVTLSSWTGGGSRSGTLTFGLANSWSYAVGNYTTTLTFTLVIP